MEHVEPGIYGATGYDTSNLEIRPWEGRAVLLVDLDAFFASVEQLDHPAWRGKPVIVGGDPTRRGVVSTASYEARRFGVHSAMPSSTATRLCPDAIWTEGNFSRYREMSNKVMEILFAETPFVQQVSIDEAFMDVTPTGVNTDHPVSIARRIQRNVEALGITCSIGVGTTKSVAKLASDMDKPRGLTVVFPGGEQAFFDPLPVKSLSGIGPASAEKLKQHGISTLGELARADDALIDRLFGKAGQTMLARVRCLENDPIVNDDEVKSVSNETSFAKDLTKRVDIMAGLSTMAAKVGRRLRGKSLKGTTLVLKIRLADLTIHTVQRPLAQPSDDERAFAPLLDEMLDDLWRPGMAVRLVGVAVSGFEERQPTAGTQLSLLDDEESKAMPGNSRLAQATDLVKNRFGEGALRYGRELRLEGLDTGSSSKNPADYK